jgi:ATP-binding cassette subfamily C protein CydD
LTASRKSLSRTWQQAGSSRLWAVLLPLLAGLLLPLQAYVLARLLNAAIVEGRLLSALVPEITAFAGLIGLRAVLGFLGERSATVAAETAKQRLRNDMVGAMTAHGPVWTAGRQSGHLAALMIEQVEAMDGYLGRYMPALAQAAVLPLSFILVVAPFDVPVALLFLLTVPLIPIFMALVGWGAEAASRRQAAALGRLNGYFADRLRGIVTLKLLGRAEVEVEGVREASEELRRRNMKVLRIAFLSSAVLEFFAAIGVAGVALYVGLGLLGILPFQVTQLSLELGLFCLLLAPDIYQPMRTLAAHHHDRAAAMAALSAIETELGATADWQAPPPASTTRAVARPPVLELRNVAVAGPDGRAVVRCANLEARATEHLALLGRSGSGKSTLLEAIAGLRPMGGALLLDAVPVVPLLNRVLPGMGMLAQRPKLFAGSIADNIRIGRSDADEPSVRRAAEMALVTRFTDALPNGLSTRLGENGLGLSGGEAQRVALARLYLSDARLLLLDEPTSHLDEATEAEVLRRLFAFAKGRTMLIATHSPAIARLADRCVLLEDGVLSGAVAARSGTLEVAL